MQDRPLFEEMIIWTMLDMQGYVGEKNAPCCVVSIVCIILIRKKLFTIIGNASWKFYVKLTVRHTLI
jgi:hypothetical protein